MGEFGDEFVYKLRFLIVGVIIVICLLVSLACLNPKAQAADNHTVANANSSVAEDSPNVITSGMFRAADAFGRATDSTQAAVDNTFHSVAETTVAATTASGKFVAHGVGSSVGFVADAAGSGIRFAAHTTGSIVGFIANTPKAGSIITPAEADKTPVPVIDDVPAVVKTQDNLPSAKVITPAVSKFQTDSSASWPIHGAITTEFGVPEWPYQAIHTGIDISDGKYRGTTPIHPFKPGKVVDVIHSKIGLGNHIVIDHGGGITSVYGHLASTAVQVGQEVDKSTVLGYEGSTGASTGTHLHFEIRLNGLPVNPHGYISGNP